MSDAPAVRASDAERERTVEQLRDASAEGRLTLEEFVERMTNAYEARTHAELEVLTRDLPSVGRSAVSPASRRRPTRFLFSLFGSTEREGRIRVRRRVTCVAVFGNIDLDLRQATFERDVVTVILFGAFAAADVYVPEGVEVDMRGALALRARAGERQRSAAAPGHAARARLRDLALGWDRRLARAAGVGAAEVARRDQGDPE
jgi:hypothetical protein